ncbi:MAG: hypothetical protein RIQ94_2418 [Pseudomonadota bacterium]
MAFDLQKIVEAKLNKMLQQNPLRLSFYKEYERIIGAYNNGKDAHIVEKTFNDVQDFIAKLNIESSRAFAEGLDEETLAIFDLLKKPTLSTEDIAQVKKVATKTLKRLKEEHDIEYLPSSYPDDELPTQETLFYQHIYSRYQGGL